MPLDPPANGHVLDQLTPITRAQAFRDHFPGARLLRSSAEIDAARENLPPTLLPFMCEEQPQTQDIYALDQGNPGRDRVVVWNDHAIVAEWDSIDAFLHWLRERIG